MNIDILLAYIVVAFFYVTSPGPATLLAMVNGMRANMNIVLISTSANVLGLFILSSASILGLGVLIKTSSTLFLTVKFIGAFYLLYLGFKFLKNKSVLKIDTCTSASKIEKSKKSYFFESFFLAVTNPKPILFFTAIFPQFLDLNKSISTQFTIMTTIFLCISFMSLFTYAFVAKKSKLWLEDKNRMTWFHRITGGIFIGMGVGLLQLKNQS